METFGEKLKSLRKNKKISLDKLAEELKSTKATLSRYENGLRIPNIETVKEIADFFGVNTSYLLDNSELNNNLPKEAINIDSFVKLPILGTIRAGEPMYAEQNIIGYEYITNINLPSGQCFFLKVIGDSMNLCNIIQDSLVLVRSQSEVENGQIAVVLVNGEEATIKKFYKTDSTVTIMPQSSNPKHQPRVIDIKKVKVEIIGKVVQTIINYE